MIIVSSIIKLLVLVWRRESFINFFKIEFFLSPKHKLFYSRVTSENIFLWEFFEPRRSPSSLKAAGYLDLQVAEFNILVAVCVFVKNRGSMNLIRAQFFCFAKTRAASFKFSLQKFE
jgi:hypothetical protein